MDKEDIIDLRKFDVFSIAATLKVTSKDPIVTS
jgi:hypothetical protein